MSSDRYIFCFYGTDRNVMQTLALVPDVDRHDLFVFRYLFLKYTTCTSYCVMAFTDAVAYLMVLELFKYL